jgi:hypothetical protein
MRVLPLESTTGPAAVLSGATILLGHAVVIENKGRQFVIVASDREKLLDAASYLIDANKVIEEHVYAVALCKRGNMRTPARPNGV